MPEVRSLLDQVFGQKGVEVDSGIKEFFLDTEALRAEYTRSHHELAKLQEKITRREVIEVLLAPGIEPCNACKGSGKSHSNVYGFGSPTPTCVFCLGSGFRKRPLQKES